jgi:hypothetical protein
MTFGYIWTVGQGGFQAVNKNLCDLWEDTFGPPPSCQFNKSILLLWGVGALLAVLFLIFDFVRWFRTKTRVAAASSIPEGRQIESPPRQTSLPSRPCQIVIGTGKPYETVEPSGVNRTRVVRVKIQNNTAAEISNGTLKLINLDPPNNGYKDFLLKDYITIGPHGRIFIGVAAYNEGTSEALVGQWIQLIIPSAAGYFMPATFGHLPVGIPHTFHLNFSCLSGIYDEVYCRLHVDSDNVLHLERR